MEFLFYVFPFLFSLNNTIVNETMIMHELYEYGYLSDMNSNKTEMMASLKEYQYFSNIEPTGEINKETIEMLMKPRCGHPDKLKDDQRKKRYLFASNGPSAKSLLTYRTQEYIKGISRKDVDEIFSQALYLWSKHSGLRFSRSRAQSDLEIRFEPIDGEGKIYGVALKPTYRSIIFDSKERWTKEGNNGINLLQIATHEFGHALGLGHSDRRNSVMYPFYTEYKKNFDLDVDDINGIKALYKRYIPQHEALNGDVSIICNDPKIDAIFVAPDGYVYILKDEHYWKLCTDFTMVDGPRLIKTRWAELPSKIDTAFTAWNNITYFFKDNVVWKYILDKKHKYSKLINNAFEEIPDDLDAAFIWSGNGNLYFFKGTKYWMFDAFKPPHMRVRDFFPLSIRLWNGVPNNVDDAVAINGVTYFFKGDSYYKYDDKRRRVQHGYPKSIKYDIFKCK
ncbi:hypothetical protein RN001_007228 [Aquatica leii]|uniref:Peptidase metallopeptidase domain-containing protein n=1 Tax=Aquatica leii TaxID=1421715 RepID=A0AAN7PXX8_9COLE|nr:hypothetical protein RN001_007228 [Aquatica leii]